MDTVSPSKELFIYAICFKDGEFQTIRNPVNNKYPGFVYGTLQKHADDSSAIEEYRQYVKDNHSEVESAESYATTVLQRLIYLNAKCESLRAQCETVMNDI